MHKGIRIPYMPIVSEQLCPGSKTIATVVEENARPAHLGSAFGVTSMAPIFQAHRVRVMVIVFAEISKECLRSGSVWASSQGELWSCKNEIYNRDPGKLEMPGRLSIC